MSLARSRTRPRHVGIADQSGHLAHSDRALSEALQHEAQLRQFGGLFVERHCLVIVELDDRRNQQPLPLHAARGQGRFHPLVDEAFVRGVLVDDHHESRVCAMM